MQRVLDATSATRDFTYTETPPPAARTLDGFLFDAKHGLLPAVLGRDGAAAADGRHPGARVPPASPPARPTPRPASTSCATSTPTPGSRSATRARLGHVRPDAGRLARAQPAGRRSAACPAARGGRVPDLGGDPLVRARRRRRRRPPSRAPWWHSALIVAGAARRSSRSGYAGVAPLAPRRAAGAVASSSARCAAPAASRPRARRCTRSSALRAARPRRPATCARCASSATATRPAHPTPRAAPRPARPSSDAAAGCSAALRAWWALPPRAPAPAAYTRGRRWTTSTTSPARHGAAGGRALQPGDRAAGQGPRPRARQDLDPRGARARVLPLAPVRAGRASSSRPSSSAPRPTTTRCSASAAR